MTNMIWTVCDGTFEEGERVIFTASGDVRKMLWLKKQSEDAKFTVTDGSDSRTGIGDEGDSELEVNPGTKGA